MSALPKMIVQGYKELVRGQRGWGERQAGDRGVNHARHVSALPKMIVQGYKELVRGSRGEGGWGGKAVFSLFKRC